MMSSRLDYINNVNEFISSSKSTLNNILDVLGWQKPTVDISYSKSEALVVCPNDSNHVLPESSLEKHVAQCSLKKNGYCSDDVFFLPANEEGRNVITIGEDALENLLKSAVVSGSGVQRRAIPQTSDRLFADFTPTERCAIYDYAVKNTSRPEAAVEDINLPFNKNQDESKPKSLEELLAAERDAKRRRTRYRSKNVHTGRKTQTEVLGEVIQSQMEGYEEWLLEQGCQFPKEQKITKTDNAIHNSEKSHNDTNTVTGDDKRARKEIVRNWDDWFYYKGNPHKLYLTIIAEEREAERRKKESKRSHDGMDSNKDNRRRHNGDDRYLVDKERYAKNIKSSRDREKSFEKINYRGHRRLQDDKYHEKDERYSKRYYGYRSEKTRDDERSDKYSRTYDRNKHEKNRSYEYSERSYKKHHDNRDGSLSSYSKDKYDHLDTDASSSSKYYEHYLDKKILKSKKHKHKERLKHKKKKKKKSKLKAVESDSSTSETDNSSSNSS